MDFKKLGIIIEREYLNKVKKKSFLLTTFGVPILFAAMYAVMIFIMLRTEGDSKRIAVIDNSGIVMEKLENTKQLTFTQLDEKDPEAVKNNLSDIDADILLYISPLDSATKSVTATTYADKPMGMETAEVIENRINDAHKAMKDAEKIVQEYEGMQDDEQLRGLIAERGEAEQVITRAGGLNDQLEEEQTKYDAAVAAAEADLTEAVSYRDMAQRQLLLSGVTIADSRVDNWGFLYREHPILFAHKENLDTDAERWYFAIDTPAGRKTVAVKVTGEIDPDKSDPFFASLSAVSGNYTPAPLVYTIRPGDNAQPRFASLFGPGMGFTLLAADPVGDLELAGLLDGLAGSGDSSEAQDPSLEVQTPATDSSEPGAGSEAGLTEPGSEGTDQPATPPNPGTEPGGEEPAAGTNTDPSTGTNDDPNAGSSTESNTGTGTESNTGTSGASNTSTNSEEDDSDSDSDDNQDYVEIPTHIYVQIIAYCKSELGVQTAKNNLENVPHDALDRAKAAVAEQQSVVDGIQNQIDQRMATLPTSTAYITAQANYQAAKSTYYNLLESLESRQQADAQTQAMGYIDLQDLAAQIERQKEKIAELSGGEDNQILAKVNGTVQSLGCVAGDTKVKDDVLCSIEVPDRGYYLEFSVTNEQARRLRVGDSASVSNYYWGNQVEATLRSITVDPKNPQTNKILTFDLSGDVTSGADLTISVGSKSATYDNIVPNSAIRSDTNGTFVFAVEAKSSPLGNRYIARRVAVEVLAADDNNSAVTGSFGYGSYVITTSNAPIKNGDLVRLADNG